AQDGVIVQNIRFPVGQLQSTPMPEQQDPRQQQHHRERGFTAIVQQHKPRGNDDGGVEDRLPQPVPLHPDVFLPFLLGIHDLGLWKSPAFQLPFADSPRAEKAGDFLSQSSSVYHYSQRNVKRDITRPRMSTTVTTATDVRFQLPFSQRSSTRMTTCVSGSNPAICCTKSGMM